MADDDTAATSPCRKRRPPSSDGAEAPAPAATGGDGVSTGSTCRTLAVLFIVRHGFPLADVWQAWWHPRQWPARWQVQPLAVTTTPLPAPPPAGVAVTVVADLPTVANPSTAVALLLRAAADVPTLAASVLVSEHSVPLYSVADTVSRLAPGDVPQSWVPVHLPQSAADKDSAAAISKTLPQECVCRTSRWWALSCAHTRALTSPPPDTAPFTTLAADAADWMLATLAAHRSVLDLSAERAQAAADAKAARMLKLYGVRGSNKKPPKKPPAGQQKRQREEGGAAPTCALRRSVMYCDWPHPGAAQPSWVDIQADTVAKARRAGALFVARVRPPVAAWHTVVLGQQPPTALDAGAGAGAGAGGGGAAAAAATNTGASQPPAVRFTRHVIPAAYLVVIAAGDDSLHTPCGWHSDARAFDLCVNYYGTRGDTRAQYAAAADHFFTFQGPKWSIVRDVSARIRFTSYQYVWIPDDDLDMDVSDVNTMFHAAAAAKLDLAQPSMTKQYVAHDVLVQQPHCHLRYTNFVELMCPLFSKTALSVLAASLTHPDVKSGWGLDYVWAAQLKYTNIAVIDAVRFVHTKPPAGLDAIATSSFYRKYNIRPVAEMSATLARYGIARRPPHRVLREVPRQEEPLVAS